jgi:hypothetical protein
MPLKKIIFKPGVNRENTRYTNENGWYDSDKIRFRQGTPEKIGGWVRVSANTFLGICRSLWTWVTLGSEKLVGVGTNLKFYVSSGGQYFDSTPYDFINALGANPFTTNTATNTTIDGVAYTTVRVADATGGYGVDNYVDLYNAPTVNGVVLTGSFLITLIGSGPTAGTYDILVPGTAASSGSGGGTGVYAFYEIDTGPAFAVPLTGWGAGSWGSGTWGVGVTGTDPVRLWSQYNFGEDLIFGPRGGGIYYWDATTGYRTTTVTITIASPGVVTFVTALPNNTAVQLLTTGALPTGLVPGTVYYVVNASGTTCNLAATPGGTPIVTTGTQSGTHYLSTRGINVADLAYATDVPAQQNYIIISDINRFVFTLGCTEYGSSTFNPMLIRWADQESITDWTPSATNQAGFLQLSHGSQIVTAIQSRQEILVWTDSSLYSMQYVGAPVVWKADIVGDNLSIAGQNAVAYANGISYWMGVDKFYKYDGRTQTMRCDLRQYIFNDINTAQFDQVCAGTNEGFNEVWWFYCSADSNEINRYVVYNYLEDIWYYGNMARTAWLDSGLSPVPLAATYLHNLVNHETGYDDDATGTAVPIEASITSAQFDIDDGHNFAFIYRMLPDVTFRNSTAASPAITMTLYPLANSGSGYNDPASVGGENYANVTRTAVVPVEEFTGQVFVRVRGRQLAMKVSSDALGVAWQLGSPRIDIKPDGRRGNS